MSIKVGDVVNSLFKTGGVVTKSVHGYVMFMVKWDDGEWCHHVGELQVMTMVKGDGTSAFKPDPPQALPEPFWVVWNPTQGIPRVKHKSALDARIEAARLSGNHNGVLFYVMKVEREVITPPPVTQKPVWTEY